jgi:hypothetical protein
MFLFFTKCMMEKLFFHWIDLVWKILLLLTFLKIFFSMILLEFYFHWTYWKIFFEAGLLNFLLDLLEFYFFERGLLKIFFWERSIKFFVFTKWRVKKIFCHGGVTVWKNIFLLNLLEFYFSWGLLKFYFLGGLLNFLFFRCVY